MLPHEISGKMFLPRATALPIPDRPNGGTIGCEYGNSIVASEYGFRKRSPTSSEAPRVFEKLPGSLAPA